MEDKSKNLEKKAWYRILKVLYGIGWIVAFVITGFAFLVLKPSSFVDLSKSSFLCPVQVVNGVAMLGTSLTYNLENAKGLYKRGDQYLSMEDHLMALKICNLKPAKIDPEKAKSAGYSEQEVEKQLNKLFDINSEDFKKSFDVIERGRKNPRYQINFVYQDTAMNWLKSLAGVGIVFVVAIFILNLIRDIVLYITIGKKFSYWWLISNRSSG